MQFIDAVREMQIPLLSAMLLGGCATKFVRSVRLGSFDAGLGPTALFPMRLRRPVALAMCSLELGLGIGLIVSTGEIGRGDPALCVRVGTALLFLVATCALLELRAARPDLGCGCFGDFSSSPVNWRTLTRSALLAVAALATVGLAPVRPPHSGLVAAMLLGIFAVELAVIGALSPELGEALVRLGYSEPCELRVIPADRTLTVLRRSKQWRRHAGLITADMPVDVWRELCWRYLVFPARYGDRDAEVVFGVHLRHRRPIIQTALLDATTGSPLPWPGPLARSGQSGRPTWLAEPGQPAAPGQLRRSAERDPDEPARPAAGRSAAFY
jgi:hypothetical protein